MAGGDPPGEWARDPRLGRPRSTSARDLEVIALALFSELGFDETTVEDIAKGACVSTRTFFRYFESKSSVIWRGFDADVEALRLAFDDVPPGQELMVAIRSVILDVNRYAPDEVTELRRRMRLIGTEPTLRASASLHYDAWVEVVASFAAKRLGVPPDSLVPLAIGRGCLGVCSAAFDTWAVSSEDDLVQLLDLGLAALSTGFDEMTLRGR